MTAAAWEAGFVNASTIGAYVIAGTVGLLVLWLFVDHWGWWKLRVPGGRPQYIKTPRGWVEREGWERKREKRRAKRLARNPRGEENFDWLFWDPEGTKKKEFDKQRKKGFIRYLPGWLKVFDPWALDRGRKHLHQPPDGSDRDVEHGTIVTKKPQKPRLGDRWICLSIPKSNEPQLPGSQVAYEPGAEQNLPISEGNPRCGEQPSLCSGGESTGRIGTNASEAALPPAPDDPSNRKPTTPKKVIQRSASLSLPRTVRADNARRRLAARSAPANNIYYGFNP